MLIALLSIYFNIKEYKYSIIYNYKQTYYVLSQMWKIMFVICLQCVIILLRLIGNGVRDKFVKNLKVS